MVLRDLIARTASIILAGGEGTRLLPLTKERCKPAVCFGGRYRLIDIPISNSINAHIENIFVISQHLASSLHDHILKTYSFDVFNQLKVDLLSPEETRFKGTADAIRQNLRAFEACSAEYFLILSGDQLYNIDFKEMFAVAKQTGAALTIATIPVEEKEAKRMGLLKIKKETEVTDFIEKPSDPEILQKFALPSEFLKGYHILHPLATHYLGSMGIYIFKREALFSLLNEEGDDFGKDLIPKQLKKGSTSAFVYKGYWEDVGTIASYFQSNLALIQRSSHCLDIQNANNPIYSYPHRLPSPVIKGSLIQRSLISEGSIIEAQEISQSIIGVKAIVKKNSILRHSIVLGSPFEEGMQECSIGENCHIENAIIDENACIGNHVQLLNKNRHIEYEKDGIFIRDGIIIVTSGAQVPDGFVL